MNDFNGGSDRESPILNVIHYPVFGGPHNRLRRLASSLDRRGWDTIALLPNEGGNAVERLRQSGIDVLTIRLHRLRASRNLRLHLGLILGFVPEILHIRRLIRNRRISLVLICGLANPHAAIAGRLAGVPVVWQITDSHTPRPVRSVMMLLVKRCADAVMFNGTSVRDLHTGAHLLVPPSFVYYPPVDTTLFSDEPERRVVARGRLGIPADDFVVGMVANLNPMKGIEYFIRAASIIYRAQPHTWFLVVGARYDTHRAYNEQLDAEIDVAGIPHDRLMFIGARSDVEVYYPAMDVKLITSVPLSEGTTTTAMEAMACGVPVVATDVGSVREVVEDGVTGHVVPPLDAGAIAKATLRLLDDPGLRTRMSAAARRRAVEQFDVEVCADAHVRAFEAAIEHASSRHRLPRRFNHGMSLASSDGTEKRSSESPHSTVKAPRTLSASLARATTLGRKAVRLAPDVVANPRLLPLMLEGVHPEHYRRLNTAWLKQTGIRTVLDIGANTGQFARTIRAILPDAMIYAFEPLSDCRRQLEGRFAHDRRFRAIGVALGEENGEITFHRSTFAQSSSVLPLADLHRQVFPWAEEGESLRVPMRRLDSLLPELDLQSPMLVKIDVQGFEDRVLRGGEEAIRKAELVVIETAFEQLYQGQADFSVVYELMSRYGFRYAGNLDQITNSSNGRPLYADALFLRDR